MARKAANLVGANRLDSGGRIDRSRILNFRFNGRTYQGYAGDTLASALLANGVKAVASSFKYGRPRGIVGHGVEEPNAIIQLGNGAESVPNLRATEVELYEGLEASSVGDLPGKSLSVKRLAGIFSRILPAGFYYKTFMRPKQFWAGYEHFIRKAAGLGTVPVGSDPDTYDKINQHCDVLIIGAGPAGLAAALAAARCGARVILADEQNELGGSLLASTQNFGHQTAADWIVKTVAELRSLENVELLPRSTVFGYYDHNFLAILERRTDHLGTVANTGARQRLHRVRAGQVILATGAIERPLVFANNDLPGVMLASSVSAYINRYGVAPGRKLVLFTSNDNAYQTAIDWSRAGRQVVAVIDSRKSPSAELLALMADQGIEVLCGYGVIEATGKKMLAGALIAPLNTAGTAVTGGSRLLACDLIASSGGWTPAIHLSSHTGTRPRWNQSIAGFVPGASKRGERSVGAANGSYSLHACLNEGAAAGAQLAQQSGFGDGEVKYKIPEVEERAQQAPQALFLIPHTQPPSRAPKQFVDLQLDVTAADIQLATREAYASPEHVKRYTALGFGTDQGKLGNINGLAIIAQASGQSIAETGTTVFRPAYTPVTFGAVAGRDVGDLYDPERRTPMHRWHEAHGARWENVGQWKRPRYFPRAGESMQQAVNRECLAVRKGVGILDASTLGKIDVQGADAAEFLSRIYTNSFLNLAPGSCRYGLMLKEDGMIFDDGVTACLAENRYLVHTTTGGASGVLAWLELWQQTEWPELEVYCTSVTDHWATATVAGPDARRVMGKVCGDIDFSNHAFRFMDWRAGEVAGVNARVFRISFTGEVSFEVNVPAQNGRFVWEKLVEAGEEFGITPYGTEAMHVLRAEKGFIIVGQDTDGSRTPQDMNMAWAVDTKKSFSFIGKRSLSRADCLRSDRKQLVGLKTLDPQSVLPEGAQIVADPKERIPMTMHGHVTSSYYSATLGRSIALAVVKEGLKRMGEVVHCPLAGGKTIAAEIVASVFYDPKMQRQNV